MGKNKKHHYDDDDDDDGLVGKKKSHHCRDPCLPPNGKTYLTIGQDLYSIQEYLQAQENATLHWYMKSVAPPHSSSNNNNTQEDDDDDDDHYAKKRHVPRPENEVPAAIMVYTDIQKLKGLDQPIDYGTGIEYADGALRMASPPNNILGIGLQVGLWLGGTKGCRDIISGKLDNKVSQLVYYLGEKCPASKIFLRIGYGK